jgi:sulfatase maturation enzyme AslB (radical SAM superfamily)
MRALSLGKGMSANHQTGHGPRFLWLELTEKCNLECVHCYANSSPSAPLMASMQKSDWINVLADARRGGCSAVQFIGGEPLLIPYLEDLISKACELRFDMIEVYSNLTFLNIDKIRFLLHRNVRIATSFYSHKSEIHDAITGRQGSWKNTIRSMELLLQHSIPLRAGIILMETNRGHVADAAKFLKEMGVKEIRLDESRAIGRGAKLRCGDGYYKALCGNCGNSRLCVTSAGDLCPCIMSRKTVLGNYLRDGLWSSCIEGKMAVFRGRLSAEKIELEAPSCKTHQRDGAVSYREIGALPLQEQSVPCVPERCGPDDCHPILPCHPFG